MSTTEDLYQDTIRLWAPLQELYRRRNELWESAYEQRLARFGGDRLLEAHSGTVQDEFTPAEAEMYRSLTARARLASSAYNQAVDAYNAQRNAEEEARARQARAQKHNATVTRIRQAACPVCFSTHTGEC